MQSEGWQNILTGNCILQKYPVHTEKLYKTFLTKLSSCVRIETLGAFFTIQKNISGDEEAGWLP